MGNFRNKVSEITDEQRNAIKWIGLVVLSIVALAVVIKTLLIPLITGQVEKGNKGKLVMFMVFGSLLLYGYIISMYAIANLKKIEYTFVEGADVGGGSLILPVIADKALLDVHGFYQYEEPARLNTILPKINLIVSVIHVVVTYLYLPYQIFREGLDFQTTEVTMAALLMVATLALLMVTRGVVIATIIKAFGDRTYLPKPGKYLTVSMISLISWVALFIGTVLLSFFGINIQHPLLNIAGLLFPLFIQPIYSVRGTKHLRDDITLDYDFDVY